MLLVRWQEIALVLVAQHGKVKYVCHAVAHSDTNAPKSNMVSSHRTFLFLLFRPLPNEIYSTEIHCVVLWSSEFLFYLPLGCQSKAEGSHA